MDETMPLTAYTELLGKVPDERIAEQAAVPVEDVRRAREAAGIPDSSAPPTVDDDDGDEPEAPPEPSPPAPEDPPMSKPAIPEAQTAPSEVPVKPSPDHRGALEAILRSPRTHGLVIRLLRRIFTAAKGKGKRPVKVPVIPSIYRGDRAQQVVGDALRSGEHDAIEVLSA